MWCLQLLDVLWACQDTADEAPLIEKQTVQEMGCLDIYFTLVVDVTNWFWNSLVDRKKPPPLTCPYNHCNLRQWTENTSVIYGSNGSSVEQFNTMIICQTISTYCVRPTSLCFAIGVHFSPRGTNVDYFTLYITPILSARIKHTFLVFSLFFQNIYI